MIISEGFLTLKGFKTWYVVYGDLNSSKTPLVGLHGGPGYPHYHLQPLVKLAKSGRPVILYDQLGCGKSDMPDDPKLWTIELFVNELAAIRDELGLKSVDILGHSWGGSLAVEYMLTRPVGVRKLILSSPLLDSQLWVKETDRLKDQLPEWAARTMRKNESEGTTDSVEYSDAYIEFKNRFLCRMQPYPELLLTADNEMGGQVYQTMWGPSETFATGSLKNWSAMPRLSEIDVPTLFLSGKYDEATPAQIQPAVDRIKGAAWITFEHSSHSAIFEEPNRYLSAIETFLDATL